MSTLLTTQDTASTSLPVDAKGLANLMLDWADEDNVSITPMKLQKLLYFCHADYLVQFEVPLLRQEFEAWDYGPVIPSIFTEFKLARKRPIQTRAQIFDPVSATRLSATCGLPPEDKTRVRNLYRFYHHFSANALSRLSHELEGPWLQARALFSNGLNMDRRITSDMIRRYHRVIHD